MYPTVITEVQPREKEHWLTGLGLFIFLLTITTSGSYVSYSAGDVTSCSRRDSCIAPSEEETSN